MSSSPNDNNAQWSSADAQSGSKFGTSGYDPGASYNAPMTEPKKYSLLKTMTLASFGLYILSSLIGLAPMFTGEAEDMARSELEGSDLGGMSLEQALSMGMAFTWVMLLVPLVIAVVFYLLVHFGLKKVKGWARITGIVMAIVGLAVTFGSFLIGGTGFESMLMLISLIITLVWAVVTVYWLVLAFSAPVRDYMGQQKA